MENNLNNDPKKQALTNVGIFVAIFVILLIGVKLATWSASKWSSSNEEVVEEPQLQVQSQTQTAQTVETASVVESFGVGRGEVVFSVSSKTKTFLREIQLFNPHKNSWIVVYDGYREVSNTPTEINRVTLSSIKFTKVLVRTMDDAFSFDREVDVKEGSSLNFVIEL